MERYHDRTATLEYFLVVLLVLFFFLSQDHIVYIILDRVRVLSYPRRLH